MSPARPASGLRASTTMPARPTAGTPRPAAPDPRGPRKDPARLDGTGKRLASLPGALRGGENSTPLYAAEDREKNDAVARARI